MRHWNRPDRRQMLAFTSWSSTSGGSEPARRQHSPHLETRTDGQHGEDRAGREDHARGEAL